MASVFTEVTFGRRQYMKISNTEFYPNHSRNTHSTGIKSFIHLSKVQLSLSQSRNSSLLNSFL